MSTHHIVGSPAPDGAAGQLPLERPSGRRLRATALAAVVAAIALVAGALGALIQRASTADEATTHLVGPPPVGRVAVLTPINLSDDPQLDSLLPQLQQSVAAAMAFRPIGAPYVDTVPLARVAALEAEAAAMPQPTTTGLRTMQILERSDAALAVQLWVNRKGDTVLVSFGLHGRRSTGAAHDAAYRTATLAARRIRFRPSTRVTAAAVLMEASRTARSLSALMLECPHQPAEPFGRGVQWCWTGQNEIGTPGWPS